MFVDKLLKDKDKISEIFRKVLIAATDNPEYADSLISRSSIDATEWGLVDLFYYDTDLQKRFSVAEFSDFDVFVNLLPPEIQAQKYEQIVDVFKNEMTLIFGIDYVKAYMEEERKIQRESKELLKQYSPQQYSQFIYTDIQEKLNPNADSNDKQI